MSLQTTRGIVLHQVRYSETSLIVKIYTENFGLSSFIFKGVRKSKPSVPPSLLQHLTPVELVIQRKESAAIHHVREIRCLFPYTTLPYDVQKSSIGLFINELLLKSLREEEPNPDLFDFLLTALQILDLSKEPVTNFHLWFSLQLTRFLGFLPSEKYTDKEKYFDLKEGVFQPVIPDHPHRAEVTISRYFLQFSRPAFRNYQTIHLSNADRRILLRKIIEYYQLHLQGFGQMKSHEVLEEVLG